MQTRLSVLKTQADPKSTVAALIASVDAAFHDPTGSIVDRLATAGERFTQLLIEQRESIMSDSELQLQAKGFVRAYLDAAEASRSQRLIDSAVRLADVYREVAPVEA